jgi:ribonuclease HI
MSELFKYHEDLQQEKAPRHDHPIYSEVEYWEGGFSHFISEPFHFEQGKEIFTDGSCRNPSGTYPFAAGAAVQLIRGTHKHGRYRTVSRLVPKDLEQSSFTGEWIGMMLAVTHAEPSSGDPQIRIVTDSAALLNGWQRVQHRGVSHNSKWDGLHKQLIQDSLGDRRPEHIVLKR